MELVPDLEAWLDGQGFRDPPRFLPLETGGSRQIFKLKSAGQTWLVKQRSDVRSGFFEAEAEGLNYLHETCNVNTPELKGFGRCFIVMEYIEPGTQTSAFWTDLAAQLAIMHDCTRQQFGFLNNNFCGDSSQINQFCSDGFEFFAQYRLGTQAQRALSSGLIDAKDFQDVMSLAKQLPKLVPEQAASLLHGDLWSGNVLVSSAGEPVMIDPAVHYGWAEADLAMTRLFGGFPDIFYQAYSSHRAVLPGWQDRADIYNLYHLLNHLNLFGRGYYASIRNILDRYL